MNLSKKELLIIEYMDEYMALLVYYKEIDKAILRYDSTFDFSDLYVNIGTFKKLLLNKIIVKLKSYIDDEYGKVEEYCLNKNNLIKKK